jgi:hypothetical protein
VAALPVLKDQLVLPAPQALLVPLALLALLQWLPT